MKETIYGNVRRIEDNVDLLVFDNQDVFYIIEASYVTTDGYRISNTTVFRIVDHTQQIIVTHPYWDVALTKTILFYEEHKSVKVKMT